MGYETVLKHGRRSECSEAKRQEGVLDRLSANLMGRRGFHGPEWRQVGSS